MQAATLCGAWRVRDVAAHVISYDDGLAAGGLLAPAARGWFRSSRISAIAPGRYAGLGPEEQPLGERLQPRGYPQPGAARSA